MKMCQPPHPGEILKELYIQPLGLSISKVSKALKINRTTLSGIINGYSRITPEMAIKLSAAFDTTPESWMNLQQQYDLWYAYKNKELQHIECLRIADSL